MRISRLFSVLYQAGVSLLEFNFYGTDGTGVSVGTAVASV